MCQRPERSGRRPIVGPERPKAEAGARQTAHERLLRGRGLGLARGVVIGGLVVGPLLLVAPPSTRAQCPTVQTSENLALGTLTLTSASSFEMIFAEDTGGSIREFYDLAATPVQNPTTDLAGSVANVPALFNSGMRWDPGTGAINFNSTRNDQGARLELLEATPTRVRVRQDTFYEADATGAILPGVKAIGDYSVTPCGKIGLRWTRTTTSGFTFETEYHELVMHETAVAPTNGWTMYREAGGGPGIPGTDAFLLSHSDVGGPPSGRTDFLDILHRDWSAAEALGWTSTGLPEERLNAYWWDGTVTVLGAGATQSWDFLTYFKPTHFRDDLDPEVKGRRDDYHGSDIACPNCGPDDLASPAPLAAGSGWFDASENTFSPSDFFNEAEAAYALTVDPTNGLDWQIDGDASVGAERYTPFFKIRQWRSAFGFAQLSFTGARNAWEVEDQTGASEARNSNNGVLETHRALIKQAFLKRGGTQIRIRLRGHPTATGASPLSNFHIAEVDPGDSRDVVDATWTQVTFAGGSTTVTVPAGTTVWSDWINFTLDPTKSYSLTFFLPANSPSSEWGGAGEKYLTVGADNSGVLDWSPLGPGASNFIDFLEDVEVQFGGALTQGTDFLADVKPVARAYYSRDILWHSTLENPAAVTSPDIGTAGTVNGGTAFVGARYGGGAQFAAAADNISLPGSGNLAVAAGTIEFWYQPTYNHNDSVSHSIWVYELDASNDMRLWKRATNELAFEILDNGVPTRVTVTSADYSWRANDWVHIRLSWANSGIEPIVGDQARIFINGEEPLHTDPVNPFTQATLTNNGTVYIGSRAGFNASGTIDELRSYSGANRPGPIAHGGLTTNNDENLATGTRNLTFNFTQVGGTGRGRYAHFGSDSKFRGLNVILQAFGAGSSPDLQWEYWNGTAWADLEAGCPGACTFGFVDETNSLTRRGTVYWTGDPTGWAPYSVGGSPDLYYVRVHLASGDYATQSPTEYQITTDILLLQYCGDITDAAQRFVLAAPVPTAVDLLSFEAVPADAALELEWRTGSELDNLGFHLHRSLSQLGPWTRITSSLIPGLGSSPEGASYSFRDSGLTNGVEYFYFLEDIDSSSVSTFHGPVSAVPGAGPPSEEDPGEGDPSEPSSPPEPQAYGTPEGASLRVLSRTATSLTLELSTPGFYATETEAGHHFSIPGFDDPSDPTDAAIPFKRAVVGARVGKTARIAWVRHEKTRTFAGLAPAAVGEGEMIVGWDGTVRPGRRPQRLRKSNEGLLPELPARIAGDAFVGEKKKLALELSPLRFDTLTGEMRLSRKLRVKIVFDRPSTARETGSGSTGRSEPDSVAKKAPNVLAYLHTQERGLHAVSFKTLFPRGRKPIPLKRLRLSLQGQPVAFHVQPQRKDFRKGSGLYFYASTEASSTAYSSETTYALEQEPGGVRMKTVSAAAMGKKRVTASPLLQEDYETNRYYQAGLLQAPDIWLWDFMTGGTSKSFPFTVEGLDPVSSQPAHLHVVFQGASDAEDVEEEHHLSVLVNGTPVGETTFGGKLAHVFTTALPASLLQEGENELTLTNVGDTGAYSFVFLDRVHVVFPETTTLRGGRFDGLFPEGGVATVVGNARYGVDVTSPTSPRWLTKLKRGGGKVRLQAQAQHRYLLASRGGLLAPRVSKPRASTFRQTTTQADYVLIAPEAYLEAAQPLLERRRDQGLTALGVSFEEITSVFGHGRPSAEAIRDFLAYAYHEWTGPSLRYVLLLGDSSYDPRNFTGLDQGAPLPALWAKTSYLWTSSDPTLGAINGEDLLPDVAIGRLPAKTLEEAQALVQKVLDWEGQDLGGKAVLVADNPDLAGDFEADVLDIEASYLMDRPTQRLFLRELGAGTRPQILSAFDAGASLMSYVGHGGAAVWASENVLNSWDPPKLLAQSKQPLMLTFNCLNGYFVAPNYDSLSEAFLKVEGRGTVGAFTPSGLSLDAPAHRFHRALMAEITGGTHERLGDAVLAAQAAYADTGVMPELLAIYHLLADPGMRIR